MKSMKVTVLAPIVLGLLAVSASQAAAQGPTTVTCSINGPLVTVQWAAVPGATGYQINVTGSLNGSVVVPASSTLFTVTPPPGTYNVTIFTVIGSQVGPAS